MRHHILNVAEKPSVAKSITGLLARNPSQEHTHSVYNRVYKFSYSLMDEQVEMLFTSVTGHLTELKYDDKYKSWGQWDPVDILLAPEIEVIIKDDKCTNIFHRESLLKNLTSLAKKCDRLILWLDCDREGENIAFEVLDVCRKANPAIQALRAHFSAVTYRDIMNALAQLRPPDVMLSNAVKARQEIDLRIGASFTRFQTLLLQKTYGTKVVSYGPCQIPTLGFVVHRWKEISTFVVEQFWNISCQYLDIEFTWNRGNLFDEIITMILFEKCYSEFAIVTNVSKKPVQKYKPLPLSTIEFEKLASKKLRISSHKAMEIAEKLYNKGFISYPRTETNRFPYTMNLKDTIETQIAHPMWGNYGKHLLDQGYEQPRAGTKDDKAHPPIHPVKIMLRDQSDEEDFKVYELIVRHFLACCSKNAKGNETNIQLTVNREKFNKSGLVITERNYLDIYPYDKWGETVLPNVSINQQLAIKLKLKTGQTSPPKDITESELITLMDNNGIGTDATIHEHIKTVQERDYVYKQGMNLKPTKLGIALVESYDQLGLTLHKPHLRALMEQRMDQVAKGEQNMELMISDTVKEMEIILKELQNKKQLFLNYVGQHLTRLNRDDDNNDDFGNCPRCNSLLKLIDNNLICQNCPRSYKIPLDGKPQKHQEKCPICLFPYIQMINQNPYIICLQCANLSSSRVGSEGQLSEVQFKCNLCSKQMRLRFSKTFVQFLGCSGSPSCQQSIFLPYQIKALKVLRVQCQKCKNSLFESDVDKNQYCFYPGCQVELGTQWKHAQQEQIRQNTQSNNRPWLNSIPENHLPHSMDVANVKCFKCNKSGHYANNCNDTQLAKQQQICFNCNRSGHYANACTQQQQKQQLPVRQDKKENQSLQTKFQSDVTCFKCKQPGHYANNCVQNNHSQQQIKQEKQCQECGIVGRHPKNSECPKKKRKRKS